MTKSDDMAQSGEAQSGATQSGAAHTGAAHTDPEASDFWVVTSYFNPARFQRRTQNYHAFRRNLNVPLLSVELARPGAPFELSQGDADIMVQLSGEDRLWQKERLLNIAVARLPAHVRYVAWVDCDVIFDDPDWAAQTRALLQAQSCLVQPFAALWHQQAGFDPVTASRDSAAAATPYFTEYSFASILEHEPFSFDAFPCHRGVVDDNGLPPQGRSVTTGLAWAARRDAVQALSIYDAGILGAGDSMMAHAVIDEVATVERLGWCTPPHLAHYRAWADRAGAEFGGRMRALPGALSHLWHGDLADRGYDHRYQIAHRHGFDPDRHLETAANGTWAWRPEAAPMLEEIAAYFQSRKEDGAR